MNLFKSNQLMKASWQSKKWNFQLEGIWKFWGQNFWMLKNMVILNLVEEKLLKAETLVIINCEASFYIIKFSWLLTFESWKNSSWFLPARSQEWYNSNWAEFCLITLIKGRHFKRTKMDLRNACLYVYFLILFTNNLSYKYFR